jgi:hypothetical protein
VEEIPQCLLLDYHAARRQPFILGARLGQLAALLYPTRCAHAAGPPPRLLFDGEIPHETGVSAMVSQHLLLRRRRRQPITRHTNMISKISQ